MKVNIDEIQQITLHLLAKLKQSKGNEIDLKSDYYWNISIDELYKPYNEPANLTIGQLSDDLNELKKGMRSDDSIPYDLKRLSEILKALSVENQITF